MRRSTRLSLRLVYLLFAACELSAVAVDAQELELLQLSFSGSRVYEHGEGDLVVLVDAVPPTANLKARLCRSGVKLAVGMTASGEKCYILETWPRRVRSGATELNVGRLPPPGQWRLVFHAGQWPEGEVAIKQDTIGVYFSASYEFEVVSVTRPPNLFVRAIDRTLTWMTSAVVELISAPALASAEERAPRQVTERPQRQIHRLSQSCVALSAAPIGQLQAVRCQPAENDSRWDRLRKGFLRQLGVQKHVEVHEFAARADEDEELPPATTSEESVETTVAAVHLDPASRAPRVGSIGPD